MLLFAQGLFLVEISGCALRFPFLRLVITPWCDKFINSIVGFHVRPVMCYVFPYGLQSTWTTTVQHTLHRQGATYALHFVVCDSEVHEGREVRVTMGA